MPGHSCVRVLRRRRPEHGHLAIGYRKSGARGKDLATAIQLDPPKAWVVDLKADDRLIVVVPRRGGVAHGGPARGHRGRGGLERRGLG